MPLLPTLAAICDVVDSSTGLVTCTFHIQATGFVNPAPVQCDGLRDRLQSHEALRPDRQRQPLDERDFSDNANFSFSAVNSLPGMSFTIAASSLLTNVNTLSITFPFSSSAVAKRTGSTAATGTILGGAGLSYQFGYNSASSTALLTYAGSITASASDAAFHALQGVDAGTAGASSVLTIDGSDTTWNNDWRSA